MKGYDPKKKKERKDEKILKSCTNHTHEETLIANIFHPVNGRSKVQVGHPQRLQLGRESFDV